MDIRRTPSLAAETTTASPQEAERRVYYLFAGDAPSGRPLARFTDGTEAQSALTALEHVTGGSTLLSRDESPALPRPSFWKVEYASPRHPPLLVRRTAAVAHGGAPR